MQRFADAIHVPAPGPYTLAVRNGDAAGLHRVRSWSISIDGTEVIGATELAE